MCIPNSSSGKTATVLVGGRILWNDTLVAEDVHQERRARTDGLDPGSCLGCSFFSSRLPCRLHWIASDGSWSACSTYSRDTLKSSSSQSADALAANITSRGKNMTAGPESCITEAITPDVGPNGWDHRGRPWSCMEGQEALLERYQAQN